MNVLTPKFCPFGGCLYKVSGPMGRPIGGWPIRTNNHFCQQWQNASPLEAGFLYRPIRTNNHFCQQWQNGPGLFSVEILKCIRCHFSLVQDENRRSEERERMGQVFTIQYFDYEKENLKYVIWGLTARILIHAASIVYQRTPDFVERRLQFNLPKY